jgi:hypothetical protein
LIKKSTGVRSSTLVFFAGMFGIAVSILGCLFDHDGNRIVSDLEALAPADWSLLVGVSMVGISAYFTMTAALQVGPQLPHTYVEVCFSRTIIK